MHIHLGGYTDPTLWAKVLLVARSSFTVNEKAPAVFAGSHTDNCFHRTSQPPSDVQLVSEAPESKTELWNEVVLIPNRFDEIK